MKAAAELARTGSQREITAQIARIVADYRETGESQPRLDYPSYRSSLLRHPRSPFVRVEPDEVERWAPCLGWQDVDALDADLTAGHRGEPIRERIILTGRWIHRGLTSQDVVDIGLMLAARATLDRLKSQLAEQISMLAALAITHRGTQMVARALTQHAVPTTFGAKSRRG